MIVAFAQATMKCRRKHSICKFIGTIGISRSLSNDDGYNPLVKPLVIIFKYIFLKLFRIHNIKLYKLIVKKPIMQINFLLNIKNKKIKLNNIHYKLNVFQKNN